MASENQDAEIRDLLSRVAAACGLVGKGAARVLVVPVQLVTPSKTDVKEAGSSDEEADRMLAEAPSESPPRKPWIPNTMVEGPLTSAADVAYEIDRLRSQTEPVSAARSGAPSAALISLLEASQKSEELKSSAEVPSRPGGAVLGPGQPWKSSQPAQALTSPALTVPSTVQVKAEPDAARQGKKAVPPKRFDFSALKPGSRAIGNGAAGEERAAELKAAPPDSEEEYVAVVFRGPFHVFDPVPAETFLIELEGDQVARVREQGQEWAWLQLETGLMGVMRNKYLRQATPREVQQFLDLEGVPEAQRVAGELAIGVIDLDANRIPVPSQAGRQATPGKVNGLGGLQSQESGKGGAVEIETPE